jgi:adenosylcobinamide-phosphate synthase
MSSAPTAPAIDRSLACGLAAGVLADSLLGDPRRGHPVALFGRTVQALESVLYARSRGRGAAFTVGCMALGVAPAAAGSRLCRNRPTAKLALTVGCTWTVTGARSLGAEAERIRSCLTAGDISGARRLLPSLCGRDPDQLGPAEITRAVVESVAENTCDAIVAPLIWGALAGNSGLAGYRAANTLDAMVGHRSPRYQEFGSASARLDDVLNWLPARVTALLAAACAPVISGQPGATWRSARGYGRLHPSPNAGWCEAAFAGALGVRLGGHVSYAGRVEQRPELGTGRGPEPADITRAVKLSRAVAAGATVLAAAIALLPQRGAAAALLPGSPVT